VLVMERLLDLGAQKLALDPAELRLHNMIRKEEHPYRTIIGAEIESGSHQESLRQALAMLGYEDFRVRQQRLREQGRYIGVGLGCYIEGTAPSSAAFQAMGPGIGGYESATVRMDAAGKVTILVGTHSHGQSHETTFAQVAADELGVQLADVKVIEGDTTAVPYGWGTWGSRSAVTGGGAIILASSKVREKLLRAASRLSEIPADDLELADGTVIADRLGETIEHCCAVAQALAKVPAHSWEAGTAPSATTVAAMFCVVTHSGVSRTEATLALVCGSVALPLSRADGGVTPARTYMARATAAWASW